MPTRLLTGMTAVLLLFVTGCGSSHSAGSQVSPSAASGAGLTASTPAATGPLAHVTWNLPAGEPASLDYSRTWDIASGNTVLANLCDNLMREKPGGGYAPALAASVTRPNATTYVYRIRQGVKFTNGQPMTAQDVAFSLQRQLNPKTGSYWALWFQNIKAVSVTSPTEVTVKLKKPDTVFGEMMATAAGAVVDEAYVKKMGAKFGTPTGGIMCTGPYSLEKWTPGASITLKANPHYWDHALRPKVGTITFTFTRDAAAITNGLTTGSIDGTWEAPLAGYDRLKASSAGTLYANRGTRCAYLSMASFAGALKDPRVRLALQESIDYAGIVAGPLHGAAQPAASCTGPGTWGYAKKIFSAANGSLPPATQNLAAAKALVKAAGAPAQPIVIGYDAGDATGAEIVASIQNSAQQVGLRVQLKGLPTATYDSLFFDAHARHGLDAFYVDSTADVPDPDELDLQVVSSAPYNYTGYKNPVFDNAIFGAQAATNPAKRARLIARGEAAAAAKVQIFLPIATQDELLYMNKRLTGPPVSTLSSVYYPWAATLGAR